MSSILEIYVRDKNNPCALYETTRHTFRVWITNCDGTPLFFEGRDFRTGIPLPGRGKAGGGVYGSFPVPPGCYLITAAAPCGNVTTTTACVTVSCGGTACVCLLPTSFRFCLERLVEGLQHGTVGVANGEEIPVAQAAAREATVMLGASKKLLAALPEDNPLPAFKGLGDWEIEAKLKRE